ncbi:cysteine protease [Mycetocola zhadangensis]|nr:cysteine protease [Mycetocola zhadangensis]
MNTPNSQPGKTPKPTKPAKAPRAPKAPKEPKAPRVPKEPKVPQPPLPRGTVSRATWRDLAVVTALSLIGVWGFAPAFGERGYLLAGIGGVLIGTGAGYLSHRFRLNAFVTGLGAIVVYFVLGSALAMPGYALFGVIPTLTTIRGLALGAVFGWADIVTLAAPVGAPDYITVLPYVAGWIVGLVSAVLVLRWMPRHDRTPGRLAVLLIGPIALYVLGVLIGTQTPFLASVRGIAFAVVALIWLGWRRGSATNASLQERKGLNKNKLIGTAIIAVAAVLVTGLAGSALVPASESRFVLREKIVPPFDPQDYPSPLGGFRKYTKDLGESELLKVSGLKAADKVRLAVMDTYDGRLWDVAGPEAQTGGSGSFTLVGETMPEAPLLKSGSTRSVSVSVEAYSGVWLPVVGYPSQLALPTEPEDKTQDLRYNAATATTVLTSGVKKGYSYSFDADMQDAYSDDALKNVPTADVTLPAVDRVPDVVAAKAAEYVGTATDPIGQLREIERQLKVNGFLSHGLASDAVPSRAGHGADRIEELFTRNQMIGDEEQFAAAFALMARSLGYPARVVMGFAPENVEEGEAVTITGEDVTAWVEVPFEGIGWISFQPTPDEKEIPQDQNPKPKTEPQPQVRQPPRAEKQAEDLLTNVDINDSDDDKKDDDEFALPGWLVAILWIVGIPLVLYLVPLLIIAALKAKRRTRRREAATADARAAGAWDEALDSYAELGFTVPPVGTRGMLARDLGAQVSATTTLERERTDAAPSAPESASGFLTRLATGADEAVFAGVDAPDDRVDDLWSASESSSKIAASAVGWWRRQLSKFRISSRPTNSARKTTPTGGTRKRRRGSSDK